MIAVVTTDQMKSIDHESIGGNSAVGYSYMHKAGIGLCEAVEAILPDVDDGDIAIICGKGNNGGDGYVLGRLLLDKGYQVMCYSLCPEDALKGEARLALDDYLAKEGNFFYIDDIAELEGLDRFSLIVDALLGTGIQGNPKRIYAEAIKHINNSAKPILAVDTPSGLNNDTGEPSASVVKAHVTITMGFPKIGQLFYPGRSFCGSLHIKDLGYPLDVVEKNSSLISIGTRRDLEKLVPSRKPAGSKFEHGLACLVCGSRGMLGSARLAALAALRTGCGMAHLCIPESQLSVMATMVTEPVLHPLLETTKGTPSVKNVDEIVSKANAMQALLVGPGISHSPSTSNLVRQLLQKVTSPMVLDADGLNAFKNHVGKLKKHPQELIITPHAKEFERLFGPLPANPIDKIEQLVAVATSFLCTLVFKGNPTIVVDKSGETVIAPLGNSGMATAGSGDVLAGIITSLIAQGCSTRDAAVLGVSIHGLAGEIAGEIMGEYSLIASDILNAIHKVFNELSFVNTPGILPGFYQ